MNVTVNRGQPQPVNRNEPVRTLTNSGEVFQIQCNPFNVQNPYAERPNQDLIEDRRRQRDQIEVATADNRGEMFRFHRPHLDLRNKIVEVGKIVGKALRTPKLHKNRDLETFKSTDKILFVLINKDQQTHSTESYWTTPKILKRPTTKTVPQPNPNPFTVAAPFRNPSTYQQPSKPGLLLTKESVRILM